jgi:hypothetical protein
MMIFGSRTTLYHPAIFHFRDPIREGKNTTVVGDDDHTAIGSTGASLKKLQGVVAGLRIE